MDRKDQESVGLFQKVKAMREYQHMMGDLCAKCRAAIYTDLQATRNASKTSKRAKYLVCDKCKLMIRERTGKIIQSL